MYLSVSSIRRHKPDYLFSVLLVPSKRSPKDRLRQLASWGEKHQVRKGERHISDISPKSTDSFVAFFSYNLNHPPKLSSLTFYEEPLSHIYKLTLSSSSPQPITPTCATYLERPPCRPRWWSEPPTGPFIGWWDSITIWRTGMLPLVGFYDPILQWPFV
jgi:hypothetical protein